MKNLILVFSVFQSCGVYARTWNGCIAPINSFSVYICCVILLSNKQLNPQNKKIESKNSKKQNYYFYYYCYHYYHYYYHYHCNYYYYHYCYCIVLNAMRQICYHPDIQKNKIYIKSIHNRFFLYLNKILDLLKNLDLFLIVKASRKLN